jgi:hypothetical protein
MGDLHLTDGKGDEIRAEYSFGYFRDQSTGELKLMQHHSSLPFSPPKGTGPASAVASGGSITEAEVHAAQKRWGDGLIETGACYANGMDYVACGRRYVGDVYGYGSGTTLFKPTVAHQTETKERHQFRLTFDGAVSYMVGNDTSYPEDHGFALRPWVQARFLNADITLQGDFALAMGDLYLTDGKGDEIRAEYSFSYFRDESTGQLKLMHHHSSLPFSPEPPKASIESRLESLEALIRGDLLSKPTIDSWYAPYVLAIIIALVSGWDLLRRSRGKAVSAPKIKSEGEAYRVDATSIAG